MRRLAFLLLPFAALAVSCSYGPYMLNITETKVDERATSIKEIPPPESDFGSAYSFLIITDAHFGARGSDSLADRFLEKYNEIMSESSEEEKPRFIINLGDTMDSGKQEQADGYCAMIEKIGSSARTLSKTMPHYSIVGNHDLYAGDGWEVWERNFYPHTSYYTFNLGGIEYYFLDTGNGTLGKPQLADLEARLSCDTSTPKIVFMHYPFVNDTPFCLQNTLERNRLLSIFAKSNVKTVFSGHYHLGGERNYGSFKDVTLKSFGYHHNAMLVTVRGETVLYKKITF